MKTLPLKKHIFVNVLCFPPILGHIDFPFAERSC